MALSAGIAYWSKSRDCLVYCLRFLWGRVWCWSKSRDCLDGTACLRALSAGIGLKAGTVLMLLTA